MAEKVSLTEFQGKIVGAGAPAVTAEQAHTLQAAGIDVAWIVEQIKKYGPDVVNLILYLVNLFFKAPKVPPQPST